MWWKNKRPADFVWSQQLSVGNAILDSEHRNLIAKINNIMHLIEAGNTAALLDAFKLLETWLLTHFENERVFAQAVNVDFEQHELAHRRFLSEIHCLIDELTAGNWMLSNGKTKSLCQLLHDMLIKHINEDDMQMKLALQNRRYDYVPSTENCIAVDFGQSVISSRN